MKFGKLTNEVRNALKDAFPIRGEFVLVVDDANLTDGKHRYTYADFEVGAELHEQVIAKIVNWAEAADYLGSLLLAALERRPNDQHLANLAGKIAPLREEFNLLDATIGEAERIVLKGVTFEDVLTWVPRLVQARNAVCRFEPQPPEPPEAGKPDLGYGTGFLVAPDVVLTADHNVVGYLGDEEAAEKIVLRFDCYRQPDGTTSPGTEHRLAKKWVILRSPEDQLDCALIRLAKKAGDDLIDGQPRGHLRITPLPIDKHDPFFLLQHPGLETKSGSGIYRAQPMKLSFGAVDRILSASRVGYKVNTNPGSSGSPCLTQKLQAVALHRAGTDEYNQAVTFQAIRAFLQSKQAELAAADLGSLIA